MGFRSGFCESQAPENRVTTHDGPFAGGGEERDPLVDEETDDSPEIITPETEVETSESDQETEPAESEPTETEPEPEPEDQTGFGVLVALVALLAAIGLRRQIT